MTEHKLSESELNEISSILENGTEDYAPAIYTAQQYKEGNCPLSSVESTMRSAMQKYSELILTRERERVKGLVSTLEEIATFYSVGHPVREMIEKTLTNYQKTKEQ